MSLYRYYLTKVIVSSPQPAVVDRTSSHVTTTHVMFLLSQAEEDILLICRGQMKLHCKVIRLLSKNAWPYLLF